MDFIIRILILLNALVKGQVNSQTDEFMIQIEKLGSEAFWISKYNNESTYEEHILNNQNETWLLIFLEVGDQRIQNLSAAINQLS